MTVNLNGNFQFVFNDLFLWVFKGGLVLWSIILGKFFTLVIFDGEFVLFNFYDKFQGVFIVLLGVLFYFLLFFLNVKIYLDIYYIEMGYLNWFFGDFFRNGGYIFLVFRDWDKMWFEIVGSIGIRRVLINFSTKMTYYRGSFKLSLILFLFFVFFLIVLFFSLLIKVWF